MATLWTVSKHPAGQNIWDNNDVPAEVGVIVMTVGWFYALWCYIRGKGRNGAWILMAFLNVFGLIVILCLKDKHKDVASTPGTSVDLRSS